MLFFILYGYVLKVHCFTRRQHGSSRDATGCFLCVCSN